MRRSVVNGAGHRAGRAGAVSPTVTLPTADGRLETYRPRPARDWPAPQTDFNRVAYAAAHVVADPLAANDPWLDAALDWDATLAYRRYLWQHGLGVAEAMDTAQRGAGLDWPTALQLIRRSTADARACGAGGSAPIVCGAGTDQLAAAPGVTIADVIGAYQHQCEAIEACGGRIVLMASRALAACAVSPDDYREVYGRILSQLRQPAIIHWLGDMFDPALSGYWGHDDPEAAMRVCLDVLYDHADKVDGIKISLLDADREIAMRRRLPPAVRMYCGDDFNYPELIAGDEHGYSDALLGVFDPIAPAAGHALAQLAADDLAGYRATFEPTVALSRHLFRAPTRFYKTGVVLLAYLNGLQQHFVMIGGQQSARSALHCADVFRLGDRAGLLRDPELAAARMRRLLSLYGVD